MKYVPGLMVGQLSGSAGNTVASRNKWGSYLRTRTMPVDPGTAAQLDQRAAFTSIGAEWRELTNAQRLDWAGLGDQMVRLNSLGQTYTLSGFQAFMSVNDTLDKMGLAGLTEPPVLNEPTALETIAITLDDTPLFSIAYTATPLAAGTKLLVQATAGVSPGINFMPRSGYRTIFYSAAAAASPANVLASYQAKFGNPTLDEKIFTRMCVINPSGFRSEWQMVAQIVVGGA